MKNPNKKRLTRAFSFVLLSIGIAFWSGAQAKAAAPLEIAISNDSTATYNLGIGISSLVKVKLLPTDGVDLDIVVMSDDQETLRAVQSGNVDFALVTLGDTQLNLDDNVQTLGTFGKVGGSLRQLLVRREVSDSIAQDILTSIFSGVDFLAAIDPQLSELHPDSAVIGLTLPLHNGAKRFYATWWAAPGGEATPKVAALPATDPPIATTEKPSETADSTIPTDARNFVLYFGFDSDALNDAANQTLLEAAAFAETLGSPAIIVAAYTDSVGDAEYNYLLAERRADSVLDELERLGVQYSQIDLSLFGERSPWAVKLNDVSEANNRRVELFIEEPVLEVQPLPTTTGAIDLPVSDQAITPASQTTKATTPEQGLPLPKKPAGGPIQKLPLTDTVRPLM